MAAVDDVPEDVRVAVKRRDYRRTQAMHALRLTKMQEASKAKRAFEHKKHK